MCQRVSRFGLYHARVDEPDRRAALAVLRSPVGIECFDDCYLCIPSLLPAVLEFRPSAITCTLACRPERSLRSKS